MPAQVGIIYSKAVVDIQEALNRLQTLEGRMKQLEGRSTKIDAQSAVRGLESLSKVAGSVWDAYDKLTGGIQKFGDGLVHTGQIMATWSYRMMLATAPLAAAGVASFKMAQDLETSMAMVATQLQIRGPELERFIDRTTKGIVDLSTTLPLATKDIADALYYLVSSMTIDPEVATKFLEPIAKAAVAGHTTAQQVAEAIAPILNVYEDLGKDTEGVEHVLDVLFETVRRGKGEFSDIAIQVGDFIQVAELAGATFEEAMAAFAMATRVTTPAQAATWIANLYRSLFTPKSVEALGELGIKVEQIVDGTGQWIAKNKELSESETETLGILSERIATAQERVQEAVLDVNIAVGKAESTWDDYTGSIITSLETGQLIEGVSKTGINAFQRLQAAQQDLAEAQAEYAVITGKTTETYQAWTGELERRPTLDIITDLAEKIGVLKSEQEKLNVIYEVFPRLRGMQGAVLFIENLAEITEWEKEFVEATGLTEEAFGIMMGTFESKIGVLKNMFLALGFDLMEEYADDIKRLIGGLTDLFGAFRELPADTKSKAAAIAAMLVAAGPIALGGSVVVMGIGALINLFGALISLPSLAIMTAVGILFGDKIPIFLGAVGAYGGGLEGFATSVGHLAVHFGLLSEKDAIGILAGLGIEVDKFDDQKIDDIATGIENIVTAVSAGIEDFKEWVQAFGDFLRDVQEREGAVGALVGYLERLWVIVKDVAGFAAPTLGIPEKPYEEWGREEKAGIIDKAMAFLIGSKLASWIFAGLAAGLKALITAGILLKAFGVVGTGATATATGGGVIATAGVAIGAALSGVIVLGLTLALPLGMIAVADYLEERFPGGIPILAPRPELEPGPLWDRILGPMPEPEWGQEPPELSPLGQWFENKLFPWLGEQWRGFWDEVFDYPSQRVSMLERDMFPESTEGLFTPEDPTMERFLNFVGLMSRTETTPLLARQNLI